MKLAFVPSLLCLLAAASRCLAASAADDAKAVEFFENKIRPVLAEKCYSCHSVKSGKNKGGLLLDTRESTRQGGDTAAAVVPGDAEKSLLLKAIGYADEDLQMPPKKQLPAEVVADFATWIAMGAADPREGKPGSATTINIEEGRKHWSFQPLSNPPVPEVKDKQWPRTDIDRFILAALEEKGIKPVADAQPHELRRRLSYDLTGLPPELEERNSPSSSQSEIPNPQSEIERLIASPQFGERWGRHWLDIAGYSESSGGGQNMLLPVNFRYRDYVIAAFNADKPYDQFLREQLAGDLMPATNNAQRNEQLIATGFLSIGTKNTLDEDDQRYIMTVVDEQIDSMGRSLLGLTLACAKCHDHKFDPIPTRDYYALAGILRSSEPLAGAWRRHFAKWTQGVQPLAGAPITFTDEDLAEQLKAASARMGLGGKIYRAQRAAVQEAGMQKAGKAELEAFYKTRPEVMVLKNEQDRLKDIVEKFNDKLNAQLPYAMSAMRDVPEPADCAIRIRGEESQLGAFVPRGFPEVLTTASTPKVNPKQSGRVELAAWIASKENPLTARVMVNRIWQHLFGAGIVESSDDFGKTGQPPANAALLDYLAQRFIAQGWSVKKLIRDITSSRVYQLSTAHDAAAYEIDPANHLNWHANRRRLDANAIRDSFLAISGHLYLTPPKLKSQVHLRTLDPRIVSTNIPDLLAPTDRYRTVYRPIMHETVSADLTVFDFPEPEMVTGRRSITTVPTQALFMMNSELVVDYSQRTARRLMQMTNDEPSRLETAYQLILARAPTDEESADATAFIRDFPASDSKNPELSAWAAFCQTLFASAEFRYLY
ncbi:PSD1 and planctomycete cytochrome C domain-containing protein [Prosthecobacter sp.]|uniref:PSD1 and planctomycete cytochrome C domain-containing protein n=1 Tax=Prosthecobacter sp. TaxID=1965333 RepID=UPI002AB9E3AC|nr:PSD1 and planctomycete cytochrome C domain-containing protein [Prosthecobacter sp.]MDZ4401881.1 PSD1 and planctomycete cytochrome C domain-containing protein [Prosthecobacter sp.]